MDMQTQSSQLACKRSFRMMRLPAAVVALLIGCVVYLGSGNPASAQTYGLNSNVFAWILANNPGLPNDFIDSSLPDTVINLPDGTQSELYRVKQFFDNNFALRYYTVCCPGLADDIDDKRIKERKLMCRPEFRNFIKSYAWNYEITALGGSVSSEQAYTFFRNRTNNIRVKIDPMYGSPWGGSNAIGAGTWGALKPMNIFFHETCHAIGIMDHNALNGALAGKMKDWADAGKANYPWVDPNTMTVPGE